MFLDDLFIIKMTPDMMKDFVDFGYTVENEFVDNNFKSRIHRFAIFCESNTGLVKYQTIKEHIFNDDLTSLKKLYKKLCNDQKYVYYEANELGEPILDQEYIKSIHFGL